MFINHLISRFLEKRMNELDAKNYTTAWLVWTWHGKFTILQGHRKAFLWKYCDKIEELISNSYSIQDSSLSSKSFIAPNHGLRTPRENFFFKNPKLLGLGRQIGLKFFEAFLGYFWPNYQHYFGTVSPLSMEKCIGIFFLQKTLVSGLKHITPK